MVGHPLEKLQVCYNVMDSEGMYEREIKEKFVLFHGCNGCTVRA